MHATCPKYHVLYQTRIAATKVALHANQEHTRWEKG